MKLHLCGLLLYLVAFTNGRHINGSNGMFFGGYAHYPDIGFYKLYTVKRNWGDAWKQCRDDGAHLVVINSQQEFDVVREMQKKVQDYIFIGVHDLFKKGHYVTVTGEDFAPTEYLKWAKNEPNNAQGSENCVMLLTDGAMNDDPCSSKQFYFICELNMNHNHNTYPLMARGK